MKTKYQMLLFFKNIYLHKKLNAIIKDLAAWTELPMIYIQIKNN